MEIWKALKNIIQLVETLQIKELDYLTLDELKDWNNEHEESGLFKNLKIQRTRNPIDFERSYDRNLKDV